MYNESKGGKGVRDLNSYTAITVWAKRDEAVKVKAKTEQGGHNTSASNR